MKWSCTVNIEKSCIAHVLSNLKKIKPPKSNLRWFFHTKNCIPNALPTGEAFFFCRHSSEAEQGAFNAQVGISKFPAGTTSALWHFRRKPKDRKHRTEPGNKCERKKKTMKKEELMKLDGMTDALAAAVLNLAKGDTEGMIPKARLDEVIAERDNARKEHADVLKELGALQKETGDAAELRDKIKSLEDAAKESQKKHDTEIHTLKVDNAVNSALLGSGARNVKAAKALLNLDKAELAEDGTVKGLADQIKALRTAEDSKFLFGSSTPKLKGAKAGESGNDDGDHQVDTSKMTYSELVAYMAEHPDANIK